MTTPPENWQDKARDHITQVANHWRVLTIFVNFIRKALVANDDYQEYKEALLWLQAEESEP